MYKIVQTTHTHKRNKHTCPKRLADRKTFDKVALVRLELGRLSQLIQHTDLQKHGQNAEH